MPLLEHLLHTVPRDSALSSYLVFFCHFWKLLCPLWGGQQQAFVRCAFQPSMRDLEASIEIGIQQFPMGAYNGFLITNTHQVDDNVINIKGLFQNRSNVMMNVIWELKTANMPKIWFFMEWIQQNVPWLMPIKMASTRLVDKHLIFWVDFQKKNSWKVWK